MKLSLCLLSRPKTGVPTIRLVNQISVSTFTKLILISSNATASPNWLSIIAYICCQCQLFSVFSYTAMMSLKSHSSWTCDFLVTINKIFSVGDLFDFENSISLNILGLAILLAILLSVIVFLIYFSVLIRLRKVDYSLSANIWNIFVHLYPIMLFYPIHFIGFKIFESTQKNQAWNTNTSQIPDKVISVFVIVCLILNFVYGLGAITLFRVRIKIKNVLSANNKILDLIDFIFKAATPLVWTFETTSELLYTVLLIINLVGSLLRDFSFFKTLPYYNLSILRLATRCHAIITTFAFSALLMNGIHRFQDPSTFLLLLWIVLSIFCMNIYTNHLEKSLKNIVLNPQEKMNQYYLLHYWSIYKEYSTKCIATRPKSRFIDEYFIYYNAITTDPNALPNLERKEDQVSSIRPTTPLDVQFFNSFLKLLKSTSYKKPERWLSRAVFAKYNLKYQGRYTLADSLINEELSKPQHFDYKVCLHMIKLELLRKVELIEDQTKFQGSSSQILDIEKYFELNEMSESLKRTINGQLRLQIDFWHHFQAVEPDYYSIIRIAKKAYSKAKKAKQHWKYREYFIQSQFIKPLLFYGFYLSFAQHDLASGDQLIQEYNSLLTKIASKKGVSSNHNAAYFIVSGSPGSLGIILDCSNNIHETIGYYKEKVMKQSANAVMPTFFVDKHNDLIKAVQHTSGSEVIHKPRDIEIVHKDGYLISCAVNLTIKFLQKHGLCYYVLVTPITDDQRIVHLRPDGRVLNYSKNFAEEMGLDSNDETYLSIFSLCPEIEEIVNAFGYFSKRSPENVHFPNLVRKMTRQSSQLQKFPLSRKMSSPIQQNQIGLTLNNSKIDVDGLTNLYKRYTTGDIIVFSARHNSVSQPIKLQRKGFEKEKRDIVYNMRIKMSHYGDDTLLKLNLTKIGKDDTQMEKEFAKTPSSFPKFETPKAKNDESNITEVNPRFITSNPDSSIHKVKRGILKQFDRLQLKTDDLQTENHNMTSPGSETKMYNVQPTPADIRTDLTQSEFKLIPVDESIMFSPHSSMRSPKLLKKASTEALIYDNKSTSVYQNRITTKITAENIINPTDGDPYNLKSVLTIDELLNTQSPTTNQQIDPKQISTQLAVKSHDKLTGFFGKKDTTAGVRRTISLQLHKTIEETIENRIYKPSTKYYNLFFVLTTIFQLFFLIWLSFKVLSTSKDIADSGQVLQDAYFRNVWLKLSTQETRFWVAIRAYWIDWDIAIETYTTNITFTRLNEHNQNLLNGINRLPLEIQHYFYEKTIRVYDRNQAGELEFESLSNSFQLTERFIVNGFKNVYKPALSEALVDYMDPESRFLFDNNFNDNLVVTESLIAIVKDWLFNHLEQARTLMTVFLCLGLGLLGIFIIVSIFFAKAVIHDYLQFFNVFCTISSAEVKNIKNLLCEFEKVLNEDLDQKGISNSPLQTYQSLRDTKLRPPHQNKVAKAEKKNPSKESVRKVQFQTYSLLFKICSALTLLVALMLIYYTKALDKINIMQKQQISINSALENINLYSLISAEILSTMMDNGTTTVRSAPILDSLEDNLIKLSSISSFEDSFKDTKGQLPHRNYQIFFDIDCNEVYSPIYILDQVDIVGECSNIANGLGRIGLIKTLSQMANNINTAIRDFTASNKTTSSLVDLFGKASGFTQITDNSMTLLLLSFTYTLGEFKKLVKDLEKERLMLAWIAVVISVFLVAMTWLFVMKKLVKKEFDKMKILNLLPSKLIFNNQLLRKYIIPNSRDFTRLRTDQMDL